MGFKNTLGVLGTGVVMLVAPKTVQAVEGYKGGAFDAVQKISMEENGGLNLAQENGKDGIYRAFFVKDQKEETTEGGGGDGDTDDTETGNDEFIKPDEIVDEDGDEKVDEDGDTPQSSSETLGEDPNPLLDVAKYIRDNFNIKLNDIFEQMLLSDQLAATMTINKIYEDPELNEEAKRTISLVLLKDFSWDPRCVIINENEEISNIADAITEDHPYFKKCEYYSGVCRDMSQSPEVGKIMDEVFQQQQLRSERLDKESERLDKESERLDKESERLDKESERLDKESERLDKESERLDKESEARQFINASLKEALSKIAKTP